MFTGTGTITWLAASVSIAMTLFLVASGLLVFNRIQRNFVDTI
jgi:ABC-type polysaccharide/polyol phosphate export permease